MTDVLSTLLSFDELIARYGDNTRYELIDGELRDMEPTGPHEAVAGSVAGRIYSAIPNNRLLQSVSWWMVFTNSSNIAWESRSLLICSRIYN